MIIIVTTKIPFLSSDLSDLGIKGKHLILKAPADINPTVKEKEIREHLNALGASIVAINKTTLAFNAPPRRREKTAAIKLLEGLFRLLRNTLN